MPDACWIHGLVEAHERQLVAYAYRLLGDPEQARDVVQDAFLRLCSQERSGLEGHAVAWLFSVCRNLACDRLRRRHREVPMDAQRHELAAPTGDAEPPSRSLEAAEAKDGLLALLATLPPRQQEVLRLRFQHGLAYRDIAAVTGLTATNVGFLIHTAIKALQQRVPAELAAAQP